MVQTQSQVSYDVTKNESFYNHDVTLAPSIFRKKTSKSNRFNKLCFILLIRGTKEGQSETQLTLGRGSPRGENTGLGEGLTPNFRLGAHNEVKPRNFR